MLAVAARADQDVAGFTSRWTRPCRAPRRARRRPGDQLDGPLGARAALLAQQRPQVGPVDEAHRHVQPAALLAGVEHRHHVRMVDRGGEPALALEAGAEHRIGGERGAISFSATGRSSARSVARYTIPMPPRPATARCGGRRTSSRPRARPSLGARREASRAPSPGSSRCRPAATARTASTSSVSAPSLSTYPLAPAAERGPREVRSLSIVSTTHRASGRRLEEPRRSPAASRCRAC